MNILLVAASFAAIIFIHELGHFLLAKMLGFKVEEFAVGFGRKLFSFKRGETEYSFRAVPLGGFNRLPDIDSQNTGNMTFSFYWRRFLVLAAGGAANIIGAFVAIWLMIAAIGIPSQGNVIEFVSPNGAAASANLVQGDKIVSVNGQKTDDGDSYDLNTALKAAHLDLVIRRDGEDISVSVDKEAGTVLGVRLNQIISPVPLEKSFAAANVVFTNSVNMLADGVKHMVNADKKDLATGMSGPVGVMSGIYQAKSAAGWHGFILFSAIISINIGIVNLLPIPLLDGGRIVTDTLQLITRNAIGDKAIYWSERFGMTVLGCLFLWGMFGDIWRLIF